MHSLTMTIEQVCETLGCKRTRVFQLLRDGTLERAPLFGRQVRILVETVERAVRGPQRQIAKRRQTSASVIPIASRANIKW